MDESQFELAASITEQQITILLEENARAKPFPITGTCYNCSEPVPHPLRFCNAECRDDYDLRVKCQSIQGKATD